MPTVLVVDDEANLRLNMSAYLSDEGFDVHSVESGEDALSCVRSGNVIDVCIMDMRLPGMNGNETIRAMNQLDKHIRYIVHTGTSGYNTPEDVRAIGITDNLVFAKPITDMNHLVITINELILHRSPAPDTEPTPGNTT